MALTGLTTFIWYDNQALEAATFYASLFPDSSVGHISYYQADAQQPEGSVLTVEFTLFGRPFAALNGGPQFPHSEAVSFQVHCETQEDVDRIWNAIIADGGEESMCGWCKDKWGVSWQIIPNALPQYLGHSDPESAQRAFKAMMQMRKIDVNVLEAAVAGE